MATITSYDPFAPEVVEDPFPYYTWLREQAPAYHCEPRGISVLSRYDDVRGALRDHESFSSTQGVGYEVRPVPMMVALDPPDHTRLRRIVQRDFTPKAISAWSGRVQGLVDDLLDSALAAGTLDWSTEVAYPLPIAVIADMLGVPPDRSADFKRWSDATLDALAAELPPDERAKAEAQVLEFAVYLSETVEARKRDEGEDLIHLLLQPRSGEVLSDAELISFTMLLLVAGNETTTNLIGNMVQAFVEHPDQWELLRTRPDLVPQAIEEILRYDSPIQGFFRHTTRDVTLHGETIPAGRKVMMLYGSANRDPAQFPEPDAFRVERDLVSGGLATHLAFGAGIHLCLGAPVARLEATLLLQSMVERIARFEPAGAAERATNPLLRGMRHLPVRLVPA